MATPPTRVPPQEFIASRKLEPLIEKAINALYKAQSENAAAFLAEYFREQAGFLTIEQLVGREVLDSRGNPTVEVDVRINGKVVGRAAAPSGASRGGNEALELRDTEDERFLGRGVRTAVLNVNSKLSAALQQLDPIDQASCDKALCDVDGTELKTSVGGNAITAASFAVAEAGARVAGLPLYAHLASVYSGGEQFVPVKLHLPRPMVNILNGGKHAGGKLRLQEFMIVPKDGQPFRDMLRQVAEVYHNLGEILKEKYGLSARNVGDEGGFAPADLPSADEALVCLEDAIRAAKYVPGETMFLALDCAANEFCEKSEDGTHTYEPEEGKKMTSQELVDWYGSLLEAHPAIMSVEDALAEDDIAGWTDFTSRFGARVLSVGDDLYTTNPRRIREGIEGKWANALLLKVNQIGTVCEAMEAARLMRSDEAPGQRVIVSHRSGETPSSTIADLAVGIQADFIKAGAPARGERIAKYNRLLQIEEELEAEGRLAPHTE